jgi:DNA end-binding protein Ku
LATPRTLVGSAFALSQRMARPLWTGTLSFGLVSVPVDVHTAVRDVGPHFHLLRASDKSRIKYEKVAAKDSKPVSKDELVKGYEYEKGQFIVLTPEDFSRAALEKDRSIDIIDFVKADEIDDRYFDKPYYLTPGAGGAKAYALLREALRHADRVGVAKFVMRDKQYLAAIEAIGDAIVLTTMRFQGELVDESTLEFPSDKGVRDKDLNLAEQLVKSLDAPWDPSKYTNDYRKNLMAVIEAKRKHRQPHLEEEQEPTDRNVVDLMERLRKSLGKAAGARASAPAHRAPRRTKRATRTHRRPRRAA